ncbi:MAG: LpxI family protein, partial [Alphaproteobacteria bacterium]
QGAIRAEPERPGALFRALRAAGVRDVVAVGTMHRPRLRPLRFDTVALRAAPRILPLLGKGDDALLRAVAMLLEEHGFALRGIAEVAPELLAPAGPLAGPAPDERALADIKRGREILAALGPLDIGQGCVVAGGLCLGVETLQGTDAMLRFVAATDPARRPEAPGVLVKAPKPGQDRRSDLPAIGPATVEGAARAGLGGIAIEAGGVIVIERERCRALAEAAGLFIHAFAPGEAAGPGGPGSGG